MTYPLHFRASPNPRFIELAKAMTARPSPVGILIATGALLLLAGCVQRVEDSAEYKAACEGAPLGKNIVKRNQAMEDGYLVNDRFDCIDKASYAAVKEERARYAAANTPEALARQKAEFAEQRRRHEEEQARREEAEKIARAEEKSDFVFRITEVNSATEDELARVASIEPDVAAQIVAERRKGRFRDWYDLSNRVIGMGAAQPMAFASVSGLTVNGKSMTGAEPDAQAAAAYWKRKRQGK